jgi:hypothetical protein
MEDAMTAQRDPHRRRNAYAEDMIRKERDAARRQRCAHEEHEDKSAKWFPSLLIAFFTIAFFVIAYAIS